jgi:hypothetical protein
MAPTKSMSDYLSGKYPPPPPPVKMRVADFQKFISKAESHPKALADFILALLDYNEAQNKNAEKLSNAIKKINKSLK